MVLMSDNIIDGDTVHDQIGDAPGHLDDYMHTMSHDMGEQLHNSVMGGESLGGMVGRRVGEWASNNPRTTAGLAAAGTLAGVAALAPEASMVGLGIGAARAAGLAAEALGIVDVGSLANVIARAV